MSMVPIRSIRQQKINSRLGNEKESSVNDKYSRDAAAWIGTSSFDEI